MINKDTALLTERYTKILEGKYGVGGTPITKAELIDLIKTAEATHKGTNFFSVTQVTKETTNKAPLPSFTLPGLKNGKAYFAKVSQVNIQVGYDYQAARNRELEKQGKATDFVAQPSIYTPVGDSRILGERGGQIYIRYRPMSTSAEYTPVRVKAVNENPTNSADFTVTTKDEVKRYKSASTAPSTGVEVRTISIDSVAAANIAGKAYVISDLDPIRSAIYQASSLPPQPPEQEALIP